MGLLDSLAPDLLLRKKRDSEMEEDLRKHWLRPGERLLLWHAPVPGYTGGRLGDELRLPHVPLRPVPEHRFGKSEWAKPHELTTSPAFNEVDWVDDQAFSYWFEARQGEQDAVRFADHFTDGWGAAKVVLSDQRIAVVYHSAQLREPAPSFLTTAFELPAGHLANVAMPFVGRSVPPPRVIRLGFADGSALFIRDDLTRLRVERAHAR
ncbi:hypothetical protein [Amycolatopsis sp. NPDC059657]|uniref:hypothetical protein n=1 Tax=Amycolatopsis sp. NPDC059657 TaxID=3346899 RepID=UPI00366BC23E